MFKHSVKVPRLYKVAATIAKEVSEGLGSVKQLVYEKQKKHPNIKALYALVATLFQKSEEIETILKRSQFLTKESRLDVWLAKILIVELLWGRKRLPGQSKPESTVRAYEQIFKAHISDDNTNKSETVDAQVKLKPRYVRVNTLALTLNEAVEGFRDEGWVLSKFLDKTDYQGFLDKITSLNEYEFMVDIHIPNLLIFPPKTEFYNHPAYKNGSIILQDKASCLPVHILGPPPGSKVLDMCAAPGMKTTHLAAVLNDEGTVFAVERDPRRFETLNRIIETSGAKCIQSFNKDVLTCTAEELAGVEYILVDPSCSGSGMTDRLDSQVKEGQNRLEKLTGFQIKILRSALTRFPDVKRVVYSTCSVYPDENEDVVRQVLETNYNFKLVPANQFVGETWHNFGSPEYGDIGKFCLYAKPNEDFTNGFFVAVFERLKEGEENQFFNTRIFNFKKHVQEREKRRDKKRRLEEEAQNLESNQPYEEDVDGRDRDRDGCKVPDVDNEVSQKRKKRKNRNQEEGPEDVMHCTDHSGKIEEDKQAPFIDVIEEEKQSDGFLNEVTGDSETTKKVKKKHKKKSRAHENSCVTENDGQEIEESPDLTIAEKLENTDEASSQKIKSKPKKKKRDEKASDEIGESEIFDNKQEVGESSEMIVEKESSQQIKSKPKKKKPRDEKTSDQIGESEIFGNKQETGKSSEMKIEISENSTETSQLTKSKKKKKKRMDDESIVEIINESSESKVENEEITETSQPKTKSKKKKVKERDEEASREILEDSTDVVPKKKKKYKHVST